MAKVTVIIVNYNSGAFLKQCLVSLWQSTIPLEIVVIDNGSVSYTHLRAHETLR